MKPYGYTAVARELGLTKSAVCSYCHKVGLAGVMEKKDLPLSESRANVADTANFLNIEEKFALCFESTKTI
jgi:predicted transcriptional regulator